jgi:hypothetical protein
VEVNVSDYEQWLALPPQMRPIGPKFCPACGKQTGTTIAQWQEHVAHCSHRQQATDPPMDATEYANRWNRQQGAFQMYDLNDEGSGGG